MADCDGGQFGVKDNYAGSGNLTSIVTQDGVITAETAVALGNYTYVLEPNFIAKTSSLSWAETGTCHTVGFC